MDDEMHVPTITYHQVLSEGMPVRTRKPGEALHSGQVFLRDFIRQMDFLAEEGFTTITRDQLYPWMTGQGNLPPKPILIDFDDHSMISYKNALPVMRERSQIATMFVISGVADGDPWLDGNPLADTETWSTARMRWRELKELVEVGWAIGAHTRTHCQLTTIPEGPKGDEQIRYELVRGKEDISASLKVSAEDFTYPNGLWNDRIEQMVKEVYRTARHFRVFGQAEYITRQTNPYRLPTMNVNYLLGFDDYRRLVSRTDPDRIFYEESRVIGHGPSER